MSAGIWGLAGNHWIAVVIIARADVCRNPKERPINVLRSLEYKAIHEKEGNKSGHKAGETDDQSLPRGKAEGKTVFFFLLLSTQ